MGEQNVEQVVVAIEHSLSGYQALRYAIGEARRRGTRLVAVYTFRANAAGPSFIMPAALASLAADAARAAFGEAFGGVPGDLRVQLLVEEGSAGPTLVAAVKGDQDLLVIGRCPREPLARLRARFMIRYCLRHSPCPVVVVPPPALARSGRIKRLARLASRDAEHFLRDSTTPTTNRSMPPADLGQDAGRAYDGT